MMDAFWQPKESAYILLFGLFMAEIWATQFGSGVGNCSSLYSGLHGNGAMWL